MEADWVDEVHKFWFGTPEQWFSTNQAFDTEVRSRFSALYETLKQAKPAAMGARWSVSAVIVLDQFPRKMFRGTAEEFATDSQALAIARNAIGDGSDQQIPIDERMFLYMPFMRSEDPANQQRSVSLFSSLDIPELTKVARNHKLAIDKFGRFPHRNSVLGRTSTPAELAFLKTGSV